jgi:hypothetical protein
LLKRASGAVSVALWNCDTRREMAAASFAAITEASVPAIFLALGHDLRRPRLEVVKGLLQLCDTLVEPGRCPQGGGATRCSPKDRS